MTQSRTPGQPLLPLVVDRLPVVVESRQCRSTRDNGFTLIELMVVVAVIGIVTAAVATGIGNIRGASTQSEAGKIAIAVRYMYNLTVLSGRTHRLVIDLDARTYWSEEQATSDPCETFLLPGEGEEEDGGKSAKKLTKSEKAEHDAQKAKTSGTFKETESRLVSKYTLDKGVVLSDVMTSHQVNPTEKGQAYIYFFPNGSTENALIHLKAQDEEDDDAMTVEVKALQGTATVHKQRVEWEQIAGEGK